MTHQAKPVSQASTPSHSWVLWVAGLLCAATVQAQVSTEPPPMQRRVGAVCGAAPACWILAGTTPRARAGNANTYSPPSAVVISSNRGGSVSAAPGAIQVQ